jgi:DNA-binding PadR family transcriptional regulator
MSEGTDNIFPKVFGFLLRYARVTGKPFLEVSLEYPVLLRPPPTDKEGQIIYLKSLARLCGELATCYEGPPVFESKGDQRKVLILAYFSEKGHAKAFDVSKDLKISLTNASERLRRCHKQGLLTRKAVETGRRGRRTMVYALTEAGRSRLAFLAKTVKFRRDETNDSKELRQAQLKAERKAEELRQRLASSQNPASKQN